MKKLKINGKIYTYKASYSSKYEAQRLAESWRKAGYNSRVVSDNKMYRVYVRKKQKRLIKLSKSMDKWAKEQAKKAKKWY